MLQFDEECHPYSRWANFLSTNLQYCVYCYIDVPNRSGTHDRLAIYQPRFEIINKFFRV